jgi:hypothetical protein
METTPTMHPLDVTLARIRNLSEHLKAYLGAPAGEGWTGPVHAFSSDCAGFAPMVAFVQEHLHTKAGNIVGSRLLQSYQWLILGVAIGSYLLDRRVPDLHVDNVLVHFSEDQEADQLAFLQGRFAALPDDPAADHAGAQIVPDERALHHYLRASVEAHFEPVIAQLHTELRAGVRGLWLNVADRCASNLIWLMQEQDEHVGIQNIQFEINRMLRVPGSPLKTDKVGVIELTYQGHSHCFLDRATCCYWYKADDGEYCTTCPHRAQEDRRERLLTYMAEKYAEPVAEAAD